MNKHILTLALLLLTACQSTPKLEDDTRYVKLATVVEVHVFSDVERKQAQTGSPSDTNVGMSVGVGVGSGGSFGGVMIGMGSVLGGGRRDSDDEPPLIAHGANRYTVQLLGGLERIEVMSYGPYKVGDCVKVLAGHPTEYARFFELKAGESCQY